MENREQVVVVGSGPAGLTAAIYTARAALEPVVVEGLQPGGQLTTTSVIENWPGHEDGIDGNLLMANMRAQAARVGSRFVSGMVTAIHREEGGFRLEVDGASDLHTRSIIVATGASAITLGLPSEKKLMGYGISTCAVCDGFFYRGKKVAVVGGGDSAMEEASYLSKMASHVILIHRRDSFRASKAMQKRVLENPKIEVLWNTSVVDTHANDSGLTGIHVVTENQPARSLSVDGLFMAIGHKPNTGFLKGLVEMDEAGYVATHGGTYTSVPGLFAAGDVEDKLYRQAITAAGRGCQAALQVVKYLMGH